MEKTIISQATSQHKKVEQLTPYLRIQTPANEIHRLRISSDFIILGRGKSCHLTLDDEMVSREHCRIWLDDSGNINILDLESTNGSKIDEKRISHEILLPHNKLKIGKHIVKIEYKDAEEIHQEELLQSAATTDPLTGVSNRKWFDERVKQLIQSKPKNNQHIAIVMVDIDHLKQVNDNYGHQTGDVVIKGVAEILNSCKRQQDLLARYGGEEFIVCLPDSNTDNTKLFCERVRKEISRTTFRFGQDEISVTASLGGFADIIDQNSNLSEMTQLADKALYHSKQSGRNQSAMANKKN